MSFSLALMGVGYLVGLSVGAAMLFGLLIAWAGAVPILTSMTPAHGMAMADFVTSVWYHKVRFIGAGAIGVAAIWTLTKLAGPVVRGVIATMSASRTVKNAGDLRDVDMSPTWIVLLQCALYGKGAGDFRLPQQSVAYSYAGSWTRQ